MMPAAEREVTPREEYQQALDALVKILGQHDRDLGVLASGDLRFAIRVLGGCKQYIPESDDENTGQHGEYQDALDILATLLHRPDANLGQVAAQDLRRAGKILGRFLLAPAEPGGPAAKSVLRDEIRERHATIATLTDAGYANLGTVEAAPWRLVRSIRLLVRCQRQQQRIDQLLAANAAAVYQLVTGEELPR